MNVYYVYAILVDGLIRYIGKGQKRRAFEHEKIARRIMRERRLGKKVRASLFYNKLSKALDRGSDVQVSILMDGLSEQDAYNREALQIAALRQDLWNFREGGRGVTSEDQKRLWAENPWMKDQKRLVAHRLWADREYRERHSKAMTTAMATKEYRSNHSDGLKRAAKEPTLLSKRRDRMKAMWSDKDYREKRVADALASGADKEVKMKRSSASKAHWQDPNYSSIQREHLQLRWADSHRREAAKAKQAAIMKARWADPESRAKLVKARKSQAATAESQKRFEENRRKRWPEKSDA